MTLSPTATPSDRVCVSDGIGAREFDGEWVVLDLPRGNYFGLDNLAGIIWQRLCAGQSCAEIAALLAPSYNVSEEVLLRDTVSFVNDLVERGLVRIIEPR